MATPQPSLISTFPFEGGPRRVSWSPDGTRLAIGFDDGNIAVLTTQGKEVWQRRVSEEAIYCVAWSPLGNRIALATGAGRKILVLSSATGEEHLRRSEVAYEVSWAPDGQRLLFDSNGFKAKVLGVIDGGIVQEFSTQSFLFSTTVAWAPQGGHVLIGYDNFLMLEERGVVVQEYQSEHQLVGLAWSPDGKAFSAFRVDGILEIWAMGATRPQHQIHLPSVNNVYTNHLSWSAEGSLLACAAQNCIHLFRPDTAEEVACLRDHSDFVFNVAFSPDGGRLASAAKDGTVRIWDVTGLCASARPAASAPPIQAYLARQAATVGRRSPVAAPASFVPQLPEASASCLGRVRLKIQGNADDVDIKTGVAITPDGAQLLVGAEKGGLRCVDLRSGNVVWEFDQDAGGGDLSVSVQHECLACCQWGGKRISFHSLETGEVIDRIELEDQPWAGRWSFSGEVLAASLRDSNTLIICKPRSPDFTRRYDGLSNATGVSWSPDDRSIAVGTNEGLKILSVETGVIRSSAGNMRSFGVAWSPDGQRIASGDGDGFLRLWDPHSGALEQQWPLRVEENDVRVSSWMFFSDIAWHPDGRHFALVLHRGGSVIVWDTVNGAERSRFDLRDARGRMVHAWKVAWAPDGSFLASGHSMGQAAVWDTRDLSVRRLPVAKASQLPLEPLSPALSALPAALAAMHRLQLEPPLSLLRDLLRLTGRREVEGDAQALSTHPGVRRLRELHWPESARLGLSALLLQGVPLEGWEPPAGLAPERLTEQMALALRGEEIEPEAPGVPVAALERAADAIDDRFVLLLETLGPEAVAQDPSLPLRLRSRLPQLPALTSARRRLLGLRLDLSNSGLAQGLSAGAERAGVTTRGDLRSLLPSQFGLPAEIFRARSMRGDLLFRDRIGREPPRLRPAVLVLDVSPPTFGPVEAITRAAAHIIATSLLAAGMQVILVLCGGRTQTRIISQREDIVAIWTERSLEAAEETSALRIAGAARERLRGGPLEPVIILLSHAWFGAEAEGLAAGPWLRGMFVQYPGQQVTPALSQYCEHWETVECEHPAELEHLLGRLLA